MYLAQGILLLRVFTMANAGKREAYLDRFCKEQIGDDYEAYEAPKNEEEPGKPLKVFVKFKVIDIDEIDGAHMDFRLHMYFKIFWKDPRLKRDNHLDYDCSAYVWTPDVMFETAKSIQTFDNVPTGFRIEKSGLVIMTDRYSFKANCIMNFRLYPFDTQECLFSVVFMTTPDERALLKWMDDDSSPFKGKAVELARSIEPLQYHLLDPTTNFTTRSTSYANFTYLDSKFILERRLTGSVLTIYLPTTLVVAVSWVTFWLRPEAAPARVSLSITSLLTLCTQVQQYKSQLPSVNYVTAMDIWLFVCIFVVFSTLLEFAICYNAYVGDREIQTSKRKKRDTESDQSKSRSPSQETKMNTWTEDRKGTSKCRQRFKNAIFGHDRLLACLCRMGPSHSIKMDTFCRKYFPLSFLIFAIVYWSYFLSVSERVLNV